MWEVCQVPDYRKSSPATHAELAVSLYGYLMRDVGKVEHHLRQSVPGIKLERTGFGWGLMVTAADGQVFKVFDPSKPPSANWLMPWTLGSSTHS